MKTTPEVRIVILENKSSEAKDLTFEELPLLVWKDWWIKSFEGYYIWSTNHSWTTHLLGIKSPMTDVRGWIYNYAWDFTDNNRNKIGHTLSFTSKSIQFTERVWHYINTQNFWAMLRFRVLGRWCDGSSRCLDTSLRRCVLLYSVKTSFSEILSSESLPFCTVQLLPRSFFRDDHPLMEVPVRL